MNRRIRLQIRHPFQRWALLAVCCLPLALGIAGFFAHAESASSFYKQGQEAEARDDIETAYDRFSKAFQRDPKDLRFRTAYYRVRLSAAALHIHRGEALNAQGDDAGALTEFMRALEIDPSAELAKQDIDAVRKRSGGTSSVGESSVQKGASAELSEVASPVQLRPISNDPITLHMSEDSKIVYQTVGKASGINVLFDPEYNSKRIQIDLSNVSLSDALRIMGTVSGTFWRPVTSNTIFVAQNTRGKRTELDEQAVQTFYLSNAAQANDLNDVQTALRNVLANAKLYGVPSQNAIVMRATPDELLLAQKIISDLDKARPEVVIDLAVLEVSRDKLRNIGIALPGTATIALQGNSTATSTPGGGSTPGSTPTPATNTNLTLNSLANLNATNFAVTVGQATANLLLSDSNTRILQNPRIRATDNQKASLKIGSRIPVATGSFSNGVSAGIGLSAVQTQFQYLDVGVNVDVTPTVHYDRDVTLKLAIEISSQNGQVTISGVTEPIISQRKIEQVIRLREGEANILGGIMIRQDLRNVNGTPGLAEIPLLKYFFSTQSHEVSNDEIVFLLIPHVVRASQLSTLNLQSIDTGTGSSVEIRRLQPSDIPAAVVPAASLQAPAPVVSGNAAASASQAMVGGQGLPAGNQPAPGQNAATAAANALNPATNPATVSLQVLPAQSTQKLNSSFQLAVNLSGGQDVYSVPMQIQYDAEKLILTNVDSGNLLGRDGQAVALVHRDDGSGGLAISASRPPGVAGVTGAGSICVLTFQARAVGDATITITRPGAKNSAQQAIPAVGSQAVVHVQ